MFRCFCSRGGVGLKPKHSQAQAEVDALPDAPKAARRLLQTLPEASVRFLLLQNTLVCLRVAHLLKALTSRTPTELCDAMQVLMQKQKRTHNEAEGVVMFATGQSSGTATL